MKRGTPDHPKMLELAEAIHTHVSSVGVPLTLDTCETLAVGIIERLAHFTARYATAGDIGKHSNARIAKALGWEWDAEWLITTLLAVKWLDPMPSRLYVHDWHEHADEFADRWLADEGENYANGQPPRNKPRKNSKAAKGITRAVRVRDACGTHVYGTVIGTVTDTVTVTVKENAAAPPAVTECNSDDELRSWLQWWNSLKADGLVAAGVNEDEPSQAIVKAFQRLKRDSRLRKLLSDRDALRREIHASKLCRNGWFRLEKLFGGKNRDLELIAKKLLEGGYRDGATSTKATIGAGQRFDPNADVGQGF